MNGTERRLGACMRFILLVVLAVRVAHCSVRVPSVPSKPSVDEGIASCESAQSIDYVNPGQRSAIRDAVILEMCRKGSSHVILDPTLKQFSVFYLHRDNFDPEVKWHSGDAADVINDRYWFVNEMTTLKETGYKWYSMGYPMWPMPHQAIKVSTGRSSLILGRKKEPDWPNYGIATPIYFASNSWRTPLWSLEEFFQQEKGSSKFKNHKEFHKLAKELVGTVDPQKVESYNQWPFLNSSLLPMVKSMVKRNKGICPDELYIYFRFTPCHPKEAQPVACDYARLQALNMLTAADCRTTDIVVAYSEVGLGDDVMASVPIVETPVISSSAVSVRGAAPPSSPSSSSNTNNSSRPFAGSSSADETLFSDIIPHPPQGPNTESNPHPHPHPHDDIHTHSHDDMHPHSHDASHTHSHDASHTHNHDAHDSHQHPPSRAHNPNSSSHAGSSAGSSSLSWLLLALALVASSVAVCGQGQVYKNNAL